MRFTIIFFFILFLIPISVFAQDSTEHWQGNWAGTLEVPQTNIDIVIHIKKNNKQWTAQMDIPLQSQYNLDAREIEIREDSIFIKMGLSSIEYEGVLNVEDTVIEGYWVQGTAKLPLNLKKDESLVPKAYPQTPQPPFPYKSEEITFTNRTADIILAGTITYPKDQTDLPAILLISGSGPQGRNGNVMGHKQFWVIADHFSRRGFAVLRCDDRGVGASGGNPQTGTTADFVTDVRAGIDYLKKHPHVDPKKIVLMGHSEGGLIAFMTAARARRDVAAVVSLAGPTVPIKDLMLRQLEDILAKGENSDAVIEAQVKINKTIYEAIIQDKKEELTVKTLMEKVLPVYENIPEERRDSMDVTREQLMQRCMLMLMPWYRYFITIDPGKYLKKVRCPILALNGSEDIQVAAGPNLETLEEIIHKKGHQDVTIQLLPGMNHLFQECERCTIEEYAELKESFSPGVLKAMEGWLRKRLME